MTDKEPNLVEIQNLDESVEKLTFEIENIIEEKVNFCKNIKENLKSIALKYKDNPIEMVELLNTVSPAIRITSKKEEHGISIDIPGFYDVDITFPSEKFPNIRTSGIKETLLAESIGKDVEFSTFKNEVYLSVNFNKENKDASLTKLLEVLQQNDLITSPDSIYDSINKGVIEVIETNYFYDNVESAAKFIDIPEIKTAVFTQTKKSIEEIYDMFGEETKTRDSILDMYKNISGNCIFEIADRNTRLSSLLPTLNEEKIKLEILPEYNNIVASTGIKFVERTLKKYLNKEPYTDEVFVSLIALNEGERYKLAHSSAFIHFTESIASCMSYTFGDTGNPDGRGIHIWRVPFPEAKILQRMLSLYEKSQKMENAYNPHDTLSSNHPRNSGGKFYIEGELNNSYIYNEISRPLPTLVNSPKNIKTLVLEKEIDDEIKPTIDALLKENPEIKIVTPSNSNEYYK